MKLLITFTADPGVFIVQAVALDGTQISALSTSDLPCVEKEIHLQLQRMRYLAQGKTFETKQPRSHA